MIEMSEKELGLSVDVGMVFLKKLNGTVFFIYY